MMLNVDVNVKKIQKDVEKLRETIQSLTKRFFIDNFLYFKKKQFFSNRLFFSVVPLGKILEYLQEDYEMMAKEMQHYTDEYKRTVVELRKEKL